MDTIDENGIPALQTYSVLLAALPVAVHKALILLVSCYHPYQSLVFSRVCGPSYSLFAYSHSMVAGGLEVMS